MNKLLSIGLVLLLVAGCGTSPQEKRNNYDACIIDWNNSFQSSDPQLIENHRNEAEGQCVHLLR